MEANVMSPDRLNERERDILKRLSAGQSDQQIANELFLSLNTIKWHNRQIYGKLSVNSRTQAIAQAQTLGLLADSTPVPSAPPKHNLPVQLTPFIGRAHETAEVKQLLGQSRLLTLTGPGGTGKTRLALEVAAQVAEAFDDGVYFIDLATLSDHASVAKAIAQALGVQETTAEPIRDTLKRALARQDVLLLIDNFEHVIQAAPLVSQLLAGCVRLKMLVTSRESLHLSGEQEYLVPPLRLPDMDRITASALAESEAGALFIRRAKMAVPHFVVDDANAAVIADICVRLRGLPLAIELAAARVKLLTPQVLLDRLSAAEDTAHLRVLVGGSRNSPPRQRTLRDTVLWSYNLLDEGEKTLLARLAVFNGGRSLEAVEAVCGPDLSIDVFDGLSSLIDKSLVKQMETAWGEARFVMLEMIWGFARERLDASDEAEALRRRHAEYFVALAERAEPELRLSRFDDWCQRFELDQDNIRAALDWALGSGDVSLGVRLAGALSLYWYGKGHHVEGIRWTQRLLERLDEAPVITHSKFLMGAGLMAFVYDLDLAQRLFAQALDISRNLGDRLHTAWALIFLGYAMQREPDAAMSIAEEGLSAFGELNHLPGIAQALNIIGEIARSSGDMARAKRAYEESLVVSRQTGEVRRIGYLLSNLAHVTQQEGNPNRALDLARQSIELALGRNDKRDMSDFLWAVAGPLASLGHPEKAAQLLSASQAEMERMGAFHQYTDKSVNDQVLSGVRAQLDDATFQAAWAKGHDMTLAQAVMNALQFP
jgi:predicted ATPase/DNA-binding CsgD family transcriptional regulator